MSLHFQDDMVFVTKFWAYKSSFFINDLSSTEKIYENIERFNARGR